MPDNDTFGQLAGTAFKFLTDGMQALVNLRGFCEDNPPAVGFQTTERVERIFGLVSAAAKELEVLVTDTDIE